MLLVAVATMQVVAAASPSRKASIPASSSVFRCCRVPRQTRMVGRRIE